MIIVDNTKVQLTRSYVCTWMRILQTSGKSIDQQYKEVEDFKSKHLKDLGEDVLELLNQQLASLWKLKTAEAVRIRITR